MSEKDGRETPLLTICSVVSNDEIYFDLNWKLTRRLNEAERFEWIVVKNRTEDEDGTFGAVARAGCRVIPGITQTQNTTRRFVSRGRVVGHPERNWYHSRGLEIGLAQVRSRYVLILDPDFYVVRRGWIEEMIGHMSGEGLAVFGAPYHPMEATKATDLPCAYCMLVDLKTIPKEKLSFHPETPSVLAEKRRQWLERRSPLQRLIHFAIANGDRLAYRLLGRSVGPGQRGEVAPNIGGDTGSALYETMRGSGDWRSACVTPVFTSALYYGRLARVLDRFLPDEYRYVSRRRVRFVTSGFREFGGPDLNALGCHEYLWKGAPFGFHLRGSIKPFDGRIAELERILEAFV